MSTATYYYKVDWEREGSYVDAIDDISTYVMDLRTHAGRDDDLQKFTAGYAHIQVENGDRRFSPRNGTSPYYPWIDSGAPVQVTALFGGTTYYVFTGYLDKVIADHFDRTATLYCVTEDKRLSQRRIKTGLYRGQRSGTIVAGVLTAAGWQGGTVLDTGIDDIQYAGWYNEPASDALGEVMEAERSSGWVDTQGRYRWEDRHHRLKGSHLVSQGTYTNITQSGPQELRVDDVVNLATAEATASKLAAASDIYTLSHCIPLPAGESITLECPFSAIVPAGGTVPVGEVPNLAPVFSTSLHACDGTANWNVGLSNVTVSACDATTGWQSECSLSADTGDKQEGSASLKSVGGETVDFKHESLGIDGSSMHGDDYLRFWYKMDTTGYQTFTFGNDYLNLWQYSSGFSAGVWTAVSFTINSATRIGTPSLGRTLNWFQAAHEKTASETARIDNIRLEPASAAANTITLEATEIKEGTGSLKSVGSNALDYLTNAMGASAAGHNTSSWVSFWHKNSSGSGTVTVRIGNDGENYYYTTFAMSGTGWQLVSFQLANCGVYGSPSFTKTWDYFYLSHTKSGSETTYLDRIRLTQNVAPTGTTQGGLLANTASNGTGTDVSGYIDVDVTNYARGADVTLTNHYSQVAYIRSLTLRGQALETDSVTITSENDWSQGRYGERSYQISSNLLSNINLAQSMADYVVDAKRLPPEAIRETFVANKSDTLMAAALRHEISDRVTIVESIYDVNADYHIEGIDQHVFDAGKGHECTWTLTKAADLDVVSSDSFERADGSLGYTEKQQAWYSGGTDQLAVSSRKAALSLALIDPTPSPYRAVVDLSLADGTCRVKVYPAASKAHYLIFRDDCAGGANANCWALSNLSAAGSPGNYMSLWTFTAGVAALAGTAVSYTWSAGDEMYVTLSGGSIVAGVNSVAKLTHSSTTYVQQTGFGMGGVRAGASFDDFEFTTPDATSYDYIVGSSTFAEAKRLAY